MGGPYVAGTLRAMVQSAMLITSDTRAGCAWTSSESTGACQNCERALFAFCDAKAAKVAETPS